MTEGGPIATWWICLATLSQADIWSQPAHSIDDDGSHTIRLVPLGGRGGGVTGQHFRSTGKNRNKRRWQHYDIGHPGFREQQGYLHKDSHASCQTSTPQNTFAKQCWSNDTHLVAPARSFALICDGSWTKRFSGKVCILAHTSQIQESHMKSWIGLITINTTLESGWELSKVLLKGLAEAKTVLQANYRLRRTGRVPLYTTAQTKQRYCIHITEYL